MSLGIEVSAIISGNAMMFILPFVVIWIIVGGFFGFFSRFKIDENSIEISGDFLIEEKRKIQKKHSIQFSDVIDYKKEQINSDIDSYFNPIELTSNTRQRYLTMYGYSTIMCISFYLKDGSKECLITNRYSTKQIEQLELLLDKYIRKSVDQEIEYNSQKENDNREITISRLKYPKYINVFFTLFLITFVTYAIHSGILGGDAHNGFISGDLYYVSSHGRDTLVSYEEWRLNYILGILMFISAGLLFPSTIHFRIRQWLKERKN
ncbi:MAG: hypothetical protein PHP32_03120, partial [Candidatus Izemoplasmatales bacterium]|nr:hypothetical protein [Candidatus Izemoplasmatales bacterium]